MMKREALTWSYCLLVAFVYVLIASYTTSPLYQNYFLCDTACYVTIGKYWFTEGALPYVDLWDLKGPLIFLINGLGYLITESLLGVFFIQIVVNTFTLFLCYRLSRLEFGRKASALLVILAAFAMFSWNQWGNGVEEYNLPFLLASFFFLYRWGRQAEGEEKPMHNPWWAFVYGLAFGVAAMTRLTNALGLCGAVGIVAICLMVWGKWKNLLQNIIGFLCGAAVVILPFIVYFASRGALGEMFYATFGYAYEYASSDFFARPLLYRIKYYSMCLGLFAISCIMFNEKKTRIRALMWLSASFFLGIWLFNSSGNNYYGGLTLPFLLLIVNEIRNLLRIRKPWVNAVIAAGCLVMAVLMVKLVSHPLMMLIEYEDTPDSHILAYRRFVEMIPESERNSVLNINGMPDFYYRLDIRPACRFFDFQDLLITCGPSIEPLMMKEIDESGIKWIMYCDETRYENHFMDFLERKYDVVAYDEDSFVFLFRLK